MVAGLHSLATPVGWSPGLGTARLLFYSARSNGRVECQGHHPPGDSPRLACRHPQHAACEAAAKAPDKPFQERTDTSMNPAGNFQADLVSGLTSIAFSLRGSSIFWRYLRRLS